MKRKKLPGSLNFMGSTFPLWFWRECCECGDTFRWEHGYWASFVMSPYRMYYLCESCSKHDKSADSKSNLAAAGNVFLEWDKRRRENRPSPPGPPPKPIPAEIRIIKEGSDKPFSPKKTPSNLK